MGNNSKNEPNNARIKWEVGIAPNGNVYIYFNNGIDKHFRCEMDADTPKLIGEALLDAYSKKYPGLQVLGKGVETN
jgi:hypothetical protein